MMGVWSHRHFKLSRPRTEFLPRLAPALASLVHWGPGDPLVARKRTLDPILGSNIFLTPVPFPFAP